jgi:hypothetical protein
MNNEYALSSRHALFALTALLGLLAACSERTQTPVATTVCELPTHAQRMVQVDAEISVDANGGTVIGDAHCATTKIELRLSQAASRAGVAEQLKAASQRAASSGNPNIPAKLTGVFSNESTSAYFIAESISGLPPPK